ncbi:Pleckstrin domain-containing family B member 2-like protein [Leptotrombidium deliense]|uniref:Pleckstrin domain-containing family B member 2-like protein n=1 Tax=Leptotrombidium deliense TaxID=299467 RepID=A0A443SU83_9ACAR|nr:Pleckstrin domain-containing family B member 2-like protein [Leptotrombidium deliense]
MDNSVIAKSGWLYRKCANTEEWHRNWIELYRDGYLKHYENDESPNAEDTIFMPTECISIKTGSQVETFIKPPHNHSAQCIFTVSASGAKLWIFCGESLDDMRAWQLALEQSRLIITRSTFPNHHLIAPQVSRHQITSMPSPATSYPPFSLSSNYLSAFTDGAVTYVPPNRSVNATATALSFPNYALNPFVNASNTSYPLYQHAMHNAYPPPVYPSTTYPRPDGRDLAMGMLAGAAVGSLMWGPYLWW